MSCKIKVVPSSGQHNQLDALDAETGFPISTIKVTFDTKNVKVTISDDVQSLSEKYRMVHTDKSAREDYSWINIFMYDLKNHFRFDIVNESEMIGYLRKFESEFYKSNLNKKRMP